MLPEMTCIISLKGTDTSANILLKSPSISNMIWVSSRWFRFLQYIGFWRRYGLRRGCWLGVGPSEALER
jgi:hypothetical protein